MLKKKKTAKELVKSHPGAWKRHNEYLQALCRGTNVGMSIDVQPSVIANRILRVADLIIEETEN